MVRVQPRARDMVTEAQYLWLAMTSPMNNCPGGIGPQLRKQYAMEQLAKKEAALQEKLAKMALADANRAPLSEKAQRRKEKRKKGRNKKKMENMDTESQTPNKKMDTESETPNEQHPIGLLPATVLPREALLC